MMKWTWQDSEEIAAELALLYPDTDPLKVQLKDLEKLVTDLNEFQDDPGAATRPSLVAIQEAWYNLFDAG